MIALRQLLEVARQTVVRSFRDRVVRLVLLVAAGLSGIAALFFPDALAGDVTGLEFAGASIYVLVVQIGMPFVVCYLGASVIHSEIVDRTVTYAFVRPLPRVTLLIGRWLGVALVGAVGTATVCAMFWAALALPSHPWRHGIAPPTELLTALLAAAAVGGPAYAALGVLFGVAFRFPLIAVIVYIIGWEGIASNLPPEAGVRLWTVVDPLRRLIVGMLDLDPRHELREVILGLAARWDLALFPDPIRSSATITGVVLFASLLTFTTREYDSRPSE